MMRESFYIEPIPIERSVFAAGQGQCRRCRALLRRSQIAPLALIRQVFGKDADAGWCSACGETTYFILTDGAVREDDAGCHARTNSER